MINHFKKNIKIYLLNPKIKVRGIVLKTVPHFFYLTRIIIFEK